MRLKKCLVLVGLCCVCIWSDVSGQIGFSQKGLATYYGDYFHGRRTASGEKYDKEAKTAAHRSIAFGSIVKVTNVTNGKFAVVKINDRGPFGSSNRIIDLSVSAAREIDLIRAGVSLVEIQVIDTGGVLKDGYPTPSIPQDPNLPPPNPAIACIRPSAPPPALDPACFYPGCGVYAPDGTPVVLESRNWGIQAGVFTDANNALALAYDIRSYGLETVFITSHEDPATSSFRYKVIIGLYTSSKDAEKDIPILLEKGLPSDVFPVQYPNT